MSPSAGSETLMAEIDFPTGEVVERQERTVTGAVSARAVPMKAALQPGTVLVREWRNQQLRATVLEGGRIEVDGHGVFGSLTAAAKAITGAKWNGRLFFGLTESKRRAAAQ